MITPLFVLISVCASSFGIFEDTPQIFLEDVKSNLQQESDINETGPSNPQEDFVHLWSAIEAAFRFLEEHPKDATMMQKLEDLIQRERPQQKSQKFPFAPHSFVRFGKRLFPSHNCLECQNSREIVRKHNLQKSIDELPYNSALVSEREPFSKDISNNFVNLNWPNNRLYSHIANWKRQHENNDQFKDQNYQDDTSLHKDTFTQVLKQDLPEHLEKNRYLPITENIGTRYDDISRSLFKELPEKELGPPKSFSGITLSGKKDTSARKDITAAGYKMAPMLHLLFRQAKGTPFGLSNI